LLVGLDLLLANLNLFAVSVDVLTVRLYSLTGCFELLVDGRQPGLNGVRGLEVIASKLDIVSDHLVLTVIVALYFNSKASAQGGCALVSSRQLERTLYPCDSRAVD